MRRLRPALILSIADFAAAAPLPLRGDEAGQKTPDAAQSPAEPAEAESPAADETVVITAKPTEVEQGEDSRFIALPPRDLIRMPLVESPGLNTATSIISREEINWLNANTVVDALKYVPGAWTETRGRKVKNFFSLRGQRYPYPEYLIDGAWFREFHETNFFMSAANIERIEVIRSSASLLASPGGMVGVTDLVSRTYPTAETNVDVEYGSDSTYRTQVSHGDTRGKVSYALSAGYHQTDGPHNMNAAEDMGNLYGRIAAQVTPDLELSLVSFFMEGARELKLAEPPASNTLQTRKDSFDPMRYYLAVAKARYQPSDEAATELVLNYGKRRFHGHRIGADDWLEEDYEYGLKAVQSLALTEDNTLRFGAMANHWISPTGKRFYVGRRGELDTYAGFLVDEHDFGCLTLNGGYRWSRTYVTDFGGFNVEGVPGALKSVQVHDEWEDPLQTVTLGGGYRLTDNLSLHANVAVGEIAARPGMLDANLEKPGDETRYKYDLGLRRTFEGFGEVALTGFYVDQRDAPVTTRAKVVVNGLDFSLYENADVENYGVELETRTRRFDNGLQLMLNATAMQTRRDQDGDWVEDDEVPEFILGGGASYMVEDWDFSLFTKHVSEYENDRFLPAGSAPADLGSFTEVNAVVSYYFGKQRQNRAYFGIDNLTDREYSTVAGYPDEGRRLKVGLNLTF